MRWMSNLIIFCQEPFKQQTCGEPAGSVVQADHLGDIPAGALVIPGTDVAAAQPYAGGKFPGK